MSSLVVLLFWSCALAPYAIPVPPERCPAMAETFQGAWPALWALVPIGPVCLPMEAIPAWVAAQEVGCAEWYS